MCQSPYRTVLRETAIPTIFDLTSHLNNPHSRHRKRIKELVLDVPNTPSLLNCPFKCVPSKNNDLCGLVYRQKTILEESKKGDVSAVSACISVYPLLLQMHLNLHAVSIHLILDHGSSKCGLPAARQQKERYSRGSLTQRKK